MGESSFSYTPKAIWLTGLSGAGKTTLALGLGKELEKLGLNVQQLDGDVLRNGLNKDLGFSAEDRQENIRRTAEVSRLFLNAGVVTINAFISPTNEIREMARNIIGDDRFLEIYVATPLEICEERDVKGLYARARSGELKGFTGIDSPYEAPSNPAMIIKTSGKSVEATVAELLDFVQKELSKA